MLRDHRWRYRGRGGTGRRAALKMPFPKGVSVRFRPPAPFFRRRLAKVGGEGSKLIPSPAPGWLDWGSGGSAADPGLDAHGRAHHSITSSARVHIVGSRTPSAKILMRCGFASARSFSASKAGPFSCVRSILAPMTATPTRPKADYICAGNAPKGWASGLRRTLGKRVYGKPYRGFESHSLRHELSN